MEYGKVGRWLTERVVGNGAAERHSVDLDRRPIEPCDDVGLGNQRHARIVLALVVKERQDVAHALALFDPRPLPTGQRSGQELVPLLEAKSIVAQTCTDIAAEALHACGAIAYRGDTEVSRCYRDAIAAPIMAPSQDWCNIFIGRALLEEPLFG